MLNTLLYLNLVHFQMFYMIMILTHIVTRSTHGTRSSFKLVAVRHTVQHYFCYVNFRTENPKTWIRISMPAGVQAHNDLYDACAVSFVSKSYINSDKYTFSWRRLVFGRAVTPYSIKFRVNFTCIFITNGCLRKITDYLTWQFVKIIF